jgi:hypothetical protein
MPRPKRNRREHTEEWASIKQWVLWPEQELYEQIRPIILYGQTAGEHAKEINAAQRTLSRKADEFEQYGMQSLFPEQEPREQVETSRTLPPEMRQLIGDLPASLPTMSWREIAEVCYIRYGGRNRAISSFSLVNSHSQDSVRLASSLTTMPLSISCPLTEHGTLSFSGSG